MLSKERVYYGNGNHFMDIQQVDNLWFLVWPVGAEDDPHAAHRGSTRSLQGQSGGELPAQLTLPHSRTRWLNLERHTVVLGYLPYTFL